MARDVTPSTGGSWYGWVQASAGVVLLGGNSRHVSARFETHEQADVWVGTVVSANCDAGRLPGSWGTTWTPWDPEIRESETY